MRYIHKNKIVSLLSTFDNNQVEGGGIFVEASKDSFNLNSPYHGERRSPLREYQKQILESIQNYSNTIVLGGRQVGKTTTNFIAAATFANKISYSNVVYVSPSFNQSRYASEGFARFLDLNEFNYSRLNKTVFCLNSTSFVEFRTPHYVMDSQNLKVAFAIIDEAAFIPDLSSCAQKLLNSNKHNNPKILITSSASDDQHPFKTIWYASIEDTRKVYVPNVCRDAEYIKSVLSLETFNSEYLGEFKNGTS